MTKPIASAEHVFAGLAKGPYARPAWALFGNVRNRTGYGGQERYADGLAFSLWPSRGLEIHGIEIKVDRQDWKRELADPAKADAIAQYVDRWWVAVHDRSIIHPGELPPSWGLLEVGAKVKCVVEAPKLEAKALTKTFVASVMRRFGEEIESVRKAAHDEGFKKGCEQGPNEYKRERENLHHELQNLQASVAKFAEVSGCAIDSWNGQYVGDAVKFVMQARWAHTPPTSQTLEQLETYLERLLKENREHLSHHKKLLAAVAAIPEVPHAEVEEATTP